MGNENYLPLDPGAAREAVPNAFFMVQKLLASRLETGWPSEDSSTEEQDVNIYLTYLLCTYVQPTHWQRISPYLSDYDTSVFDRIQYSSDTRLKYSVYKINADHLLVSIGIFDRERDSDYQSGRARMYYDLAATYGRSMFGRSSAVAEVLGKLSVGWPKYVSILSHMRGEYLNLFRTLSPGELYHLRRTVESKGLEALHKEFLDLYSRYRTTPTAELLEQLKEVAVRLRRLDPDFHFDVP